MNKNNTAENVLNNIKSVRADRDRMEQSRLEAVRMERLKREEAENERLQNSASILNDYIERAKAREAQQLQEQNRAIQSIHDENERRRSENANRAKEIADAMDRGARNAYHDDINAADDYLSRHKRLLDKGREAVKREQNKTYFR